MKKTISLLDTFCGGGGCSVGYDQAAQELGINLQIIGVDIKPQPNYPFDFIQADALHFLARNAEMFDVIHASPPCQAFSIGTAPARKAGKQYPDMIDTVRDLIVHSGKRGIIENVPGSPVRQDLVLNGTMFGLKVVRRRYFELINWFCMRPGSGKIRKNITMSGDFVTVAGHGFKNTRLKEAIRVPGNTVAEKWSNAMGIDWMTKSQLAQAIPPAYTKYVGLQLFDQIIHYKC